MSDLADISAFFKRVLAAHPDLDTVMISAGTQQTFSPSDPSTTSDEAIVSEITTNLSAPIIVSRAFFPHLVAGAGASTPANLFILSSTVAFFPLGFYPAYAAVKAGIHAFYVSARAQIGFAPPVIQRNLSICEVVPPYVDNDLDARHRDAVVEAQGGPQKAFSPLPLGEYLDNVWKRE